MVVWFKTCPKCAGDLTEEHDIMATSIACLQCGYLLNRIEESALRRIGQIPTHREASLAAARKSA
ncbi:MAG: hypothetical protein FJ318_00300 [SAR202 cluster bacterium]|nr:hypothetical protein [SAR202 cluster bacterium]